MTTKADLLEAAELDVNRLLSLVGNELGDVCAEIETMTREQRDMALLVAVVNLKRADVQAERNVEVLQAATAVLRRGG